MEHPLRLSVCSSLSAGDIRKQACTAYIYAYSRLARRGGRLIELKQAAGEVRLVHVVTRDDLHHDDFEFKESYFKLLLRVSFLSCTGWKPIVQSTFHSIFGTSLQE